MSIYRKIYEDHYGAIPVDQTGRSYDIHHINGDHANNHPDNLKAVSIQEHYNIHYNQGDYGACFVMAPRILLSSNNLSEIARKAGKISANKRLADGTHNFQDKEWAKQRTAKLILEGRHSSLANNKKEHTCPHCNKTGKSPAMFRFHFDKCKFINH